MEWAFLAEQPFALGVTRDGWDCSAENLCVARGCAIEKVLFVPFRPGTAHIMVVRPVFPGRTVPGRAEKRQHGAGDLALGAVCGTPTLNAYFS